MKYDDDDETDNDFLYFMRKMRQIIMDSRTHFVMIEIKLKLELSKNIKYDNLHKMHKIFFIVTHKVYELFSSFLPWYSNYQNKNTQGLFVDNEPMMDY